VSRVAEALRAAGLEAEVREFPQGTRTAEEAAAAVGCAVAQIVKSLVFLRDGEPLLVLCGGDGRVDAGRLGLQRATAAQAREATGFAIGGVAPVGLARPLDVLVDEALLDHEVVWAAAGTPTSVFAIGPADLVRVTGGAVTAVRP
jgi:prolyl-tRNA editing enzyme YbaK/EbsC (Cys-tRNA(Pro) deacylase)